MKDVARSCLAALVAVFLDACSNPLMEDLVESMRTGATPAAVYTVRFFRNYTQEDETVLHTKTVVSPASSINAAEFPASPERTGYVFSGWNTQADGSGTAFTDASAVTDNISVYAQWTAIAPQSYTVLFMRNHAEDDATILHTKTVTVPATSIGAENFPGNPERSGYDFVNWNTRSDGEGDSFTASATVNADMEVYAQWTEIKPGSLTVTFKLNDGTDANLTTKTVTAPSLIVDDFPLAPERTGYTFATWNTEAGGSGSSFDATTEVSADIAVYAQWMLVSYAISYNNLNGGTNNDKNPGSYTIESPLINLAAATRSGYTFGGWHDNDGFGGTAVASIPAGSTEDKTFWAKWTIIDYAISYNLNGGSHAGSPATTYTVESSSINLAGATRSGYTFGGWYDNDGFGGTAVASIPAGSTENKTFWAKWIPIDYTITYHLNGGSHTGSPATTYTVESSSINLVGATRSGYTFGGWYDNDGFGGTAVASIPAGSTEHKTFWAKWVEGLNVTIQVGRDNTILVSSADVTISRSGANAATFTVRDVYDEDGIQWYLNGTAVSDPAGTAQSITIKAADYPNGTRYLGVTVSKGGVPYSTVIHFTVTD